jgi:hypothetical protein
VSQPALLDIDAVRLKSREGSAAWQKSNPIQRIGRFELREVQG